MDTERERSILEAYAAARAAWPRVDVPQDQFLRYVTERLPADGAGEPALQDLYLACACVRQVPGAHEALEAAHFSRLPGTLRKQFRDAPEATLDEALQLVRQKLLLPAEGGPPHLATYAGEGGLFSWIKIIAIRQVIKLLPPSDAPALFDPLSFREPAAPRDEERGHVTRELYERLRQVFHDAATAALTGEERSLLAQYYKQQMSQKSLSRLYGTSQAGISRRLALVRETLRDEARSLMRARYGVSGDELDALIADQSRLDVTLSRVFGSEASGS
jgi:RNA polymerase sigma-70 factor, ECF subfamily